MDSMQNNQTQPVQPQPMSTPSQTSTPPTTSLSTPPPVTMPTSGMSSSSSNRTRLLLLLFVFVLVVVGLVYIIIQNRSSSQTSLPNVTIPQLNKISPVAASAEERELENIDVGNVNTELQNIEKDANNL